MVTPDPADVQRAVGARYEVLDLVGAGGMGAVFRARHRELGHLVAIKVLPPEIATSTNRQERFRREAQLAAQLSHPNLVPVYEFGTGEGLTFLIMPLVRGRTLEAVLAEQPRLPLADLLRVLTDVGAALDFAHARGVVHRDVKPANILIEDDSRRALLTDFGIALARSSGAGSLTVPGSVIGTPAYMAPEQLSAFDRVDGRTDLYALALVAFEGLTGELPNAGVERDALAVQLRAQRRDVSSTAAAALVAPLAEQPLDRPPSAAAWLLGVGRATERRWPLPALALGTLALVGAVLWAATRTGASRPGTERRLAVMPFTILGSDTQFPPAQLPTWFQNRLGPVPGLSVVSSATVASLVGEQAPAISDAQAAADRLEATYFVQPSLQFQGSAATLSARLYETRKLRQLQSATKSGPADSLSQLMDAVWTQLLQPIVRGRFALNSSVTLPHSLAAMLAYANAEEAYRRADFATALDDYEQVLAADSSFAIAHFRRAVVVAQIDPREESLQRALAGARQYQSGLTPADSLLLEGYRSIVERGDGRRALQHFTEAAQRAPDEPQTWFALGFISYHFGGLFDDSLATAENAFNQVLDVSPDFVPAMSYLASLAYFHGDMESTRRWITAYEQLGAPSVVAEVVGIADTLLLHGLSAQAALLKGLPGSHTFTALEYLAFQVEEGGTADQRTGPGREVLRALERRAKTDSEQVLALRLGVGADLREGWLDSARARLARARIPATQQERDMWLVLLPAVGLDSLGEWRSAVDRIDRGLGTTRNGEIGHWMLARLGRDRARHVNALERLAIDSAPLPLALKLDLDARRALDRSDSARALRLWQQATQRYAVLRVPFDLAASLWWMRLDLARLALARGDTVLAARTCDGFAALNGYVDVVIRPETERFCQPLKRVAVP